MRYSLVYRESCELFAQQRADRQYGNPRIVNARAGRNRVRAEDMFHRKRPEVPLRLPSEQSMRDENVEFLRSDVRESLAGRD